MNNRAFKQKKALLNRISEEIYYNLIDYVEEIYNGEYDLVITMARKFSDAYLALLPLAQSEYFGRIEQDHSRNIQTGAGNPRVISDRALDWVLADIQTMGGKTRFKKVRLVDDIIIHGTTMKNIKRKLEDAYKKACISDFQIDITAFAENMEGIVLNQKEINQNYIVKRCSPSGWKYLSGKIVDIMYLSGRPYTSYIPNARIMFHSASGQRIQELIAMKHMHNITDVSMSRNHCKTYAWIQESNEAFKICEVYRIYAFESLGEYVFVPMVSINPLSNEIMDKYISILHKCIQKEKQAHMDHVLASSRDEYKYRLIIYILSALVGWRFWENQLQADLNDCQYSELEEDYNFSSAFLRTSFDLNKEELISSTLSEINSAYKAQPEIVSSISLRDYDSDVKDLTSALNDLLQQTQNIPAEVLENSEIETPIIGKLLQINNRLDEERIRELSLHADVRKRMTGIPVVDLINEMKKAGYGIQKIYVSILYTVDFGKGSIIPCVFSKDNRKIYAEVLHAGEQNYRYYIDNYFPIMYSMYLLENEKEGEALLKCKNELWEYYKSLDEKKVFFEDDRTYLMSRSMKKDFEEVLIEEALAREDDSDLNEMIKKARNLTEE